MTTSSHRRARVSINRRAPTCGNRLLRLLPLGGLLVLLGVGCGYDAPAVQRISLEGGRELGSCDWPSVGQIDGSCTATLIGPQWILSAAHCPTGSRFRVGGTETGITRCERHPDFESSGRAFDFMVCELDAPIDAPVVPLMTPCEAAELRERAGETLRLLPEGRPVFVIGLGAPSSGSKRGVEMEVSSFIYSSPLIDFEDPLDVSGGRPGDSGGPTFLALDDGTFRQVGVHKLGGFGTSVTDAFVPAVIDWIEATTDLDTTPCHVGDAWMPSDACASLATDLEGGGGAFPMCTITRVMPTPSCVAPADAGTMAATDSGTVAMLDGGGVSLDGGSVSLDGGSAGRDGGSAGRDGGGTSRSDGGGAAAGGDDGGCGCTMVAASRASARASLSLALVALLFKAARRRRRLERTDPP